MCLLILTTADLVHTFVDTVDALGHDCNQIRIDVFVQNWTIVEHTPLRVHMFHRVFRGYFNYFLWIVESTQIYAPRFNCVQLLQHMRSQRKSDSKLKFIIIDANFRSLALHYYRSIPHGSQSQRQFLYQPSKCMFHVPADKTIEHVYSLVLICMYVYRIRLLYWIGHMNYRFSCRFRDHVQSIRCAEQ